MPVRKIKKSYTHVTGVLSSNKNSRMIASESTLERDLYLILDFDPMVKSFEEQPVRIDYKLLNGRNSHYTPDCLIEFNPKPKFIWRYSPFKSFFREPFNSENERNFEKTFGQTTLLPKIYKKKPGKLLIEVKSREELFKKWKKLKPKFKAARRFSAEQNWQFRILTENEIKTRLLDNVKFLRFYRRYKFSNEQIMQVLNKISELEKCSVNELLKSLTNDLTEQGYILPVIWQLVARHEIGIKWNEPLNMKSNLYLLR